MKITDILEQRGKTLFTVQTDTNVFGAVKIMDENKVGAVIVLDSKNKVAGILSERDVLYKCYKSGKRLKEQTVKNLMTGVDDILIGDMNDTAKELMNVMLYRRIRHIPIIEDNEITGMLSVEDILKMMLDSIENESHLLKQHIKNPMGIHDFSAHLKK
jgi:signal-transduction protein with cAMP-binding, CBS, and nucleotidyltransferase domain